MTSIDSMPLLSDRGAEVLRKLAAAPNQRLRCWTVRDTLGLYASHTLRSLENRKLIERVWKAPEPHHVDVAMWELTDAGREMIGRLTAEASHS